MENPAVTYLKQFINQPLEKYPSYLSSYAQPILLAVESGYTLFKMKIKPEMINPIHTLHGGVSAAIQDELGGFTVFTLNDTNYYTTLNNYIDYLGAAKVDEHILVESRVIKQGKQFVNVECIIWNEAKTKMISRGTSNLFRLDQKREILK